MIGELVGEYGILLTVAIIAANGAALALLVVMSFIVSYYLKKAIASSVIAGAVRIVAIFLSFLAILPVLAVIRAKAGDEGYQWLTLVFAVAFFMVVYFAGKSGVFKLK